MDEGLRRREREDEDPLGLAQGALRAGDPERAEAAARDAYWTGRSPRDEVEAWLGNHVPLPALVERALEALRELRLGSPLIDPLLFRLAGRCDLRIDRELARWSRAGGGHPELDRLLGLAPAPRWIEATRRWGPDAFALAAPAADEALAIVRALGDPAAGPPESFVPAGHHPQAAWRLLQASLLHLLGRHGQVPAAAELLAAWRTSDPLLEAERAAAQGRAGERLSAWGLPWRPPWALRASPAEARDRLTLSYHRGTFLEQGGEAVLTAAAAVLYADVDDLMRFNDQHGHLAGDDLLRDVAEQMRAVVGDRLVRWAGDAWVVPWEGDDGRRAAEALVAAVRAGGRGTVKVGVHTAPSPGRSGAQRVELAEEALWGDGTRRPRDEVRG